MTAQLPGWPEQPISEKTGEPTLKWPDANIFDVEAYERQRADAWEARARKAVEALKRIKFGNCGPLEMSPSEMKAVAREALNAIGELP